MTEQEILAIQVGAEHAREAGDVKTWLVLSALVLKLKFNPEPLAEVVELQNYSRKVSPPCA